ncbi:class I SAM-dependent methyltransferase [Gorillibacterium timonense]|uniref:class I SAM-dependent methyltransferase n=1 Tax=Gorillibacterium timonense TaxID=1689269 RepID=UPI0018FE552D|nr:class I SAM-dependent methyltransferase [Gorillibacterium timonense]
MDREEQNRKAWNSGTYAAWLERFGTPQEAAEKIAQDPNKRIGSVLAEMGEPLTGKRIVNLLGSNGNKAVALALLGAEVTVIDFSEGNERYARELALSAQVPLRYVQADVLDLPEAEFAAPYDIVFMEFGILHYFTDLEPLFRTVRQLLTKGGILILQDFHPVSTKLISSRGTTAAIRKHKVTGDYFDETLEVKEAAFTKFLPDSEKQGEVPTVKLRNWTLGEIVTGAAQEGLFIRKLEELPNQSSDIYDKGIPKTFTLIAENR